MPDRSARSFVGFNAYLILIPPPDGALGLAVRISVFRHNSTLFAILTTSFQYPMFNAFLGTYLSSRQAELGNLSVDSVYSAYAYQSACGVVGSLLAALLVQWKRGGRKFAMALFTVLNGIVLFALTAARTSIQVNALTCLSSLVCSSMPLHVRHY